MVYVLFNDIPVRPIPPKSRAAVLVKFEKPFVDKARLFKPKGLTACAGANFE